VDVVTIKQLQEYFNLEIITPDINLEQKLITLPEISRPGLQIAGFFDFFEPERIQLVGKVEYTYMMQMDPQQRAQNLGKLFSNKFPCLVVTRELEILPEMLESALEYNVPILRWNATTTEFIGEALPWLKLQFAPKITMHGVLVDIYGEGILIIGESGVGKSETAMELIRRGHRLVADDAVEIKKVSNQTLFGYCPEIIRYFMELRGIGIIDVMKMFGVQSIKQTQAVDLIINLELWDQNRKYDRLGQAEEYTEILGNSVSSHSIPIRPGRSLAVICESAAINQRQKKMGYNAANALTERVMNLVNAGKEYERL